MKQKDVAVIGGAVLLSVIVSFILSSKLISTPNSRSQQVVVVSSISPTFTEPNSKYFNNQSVDPTQLIQISNNSNGTPFNGTQDGSR